MEIIRRTLKRRLSEGEALRLKEKEPFATFRQDSKAINFGMIFGMSFKKFSQSTLETSWSYERVQAFVKDKNLYDQANRMAEKYPTIEPKLWEYYAVAFYIREQFFATYKGLMDRIKRNEAFAKEHGYIRSHHGAIRRLPMLALCMEEVGGTTKMRPDEDLREIAGMINISSNTSIQSDEVITVMDSINKWIESCMGIEGLIIGTVHDSVDFFVPKEGALEILAAIKSNFERDDEWQKGVKFLVDLMIVDLAKGEYYKRGTKYKKFVEMQKKG